MVVKTNQERRWTRGVGKWILSRRLVQSVPKILAVEVGEWGPIREPIRVDLSWPRTVLVGKNGSGKSVLLDGIAKGLSGIKEGPWKFAMEATSPEGNFRFEAFRTEGSAPRRERTSVLEQRCISLKDEKLLWETKNSVLQVDVQNTMVQTLMDRSVLQGGEIVEAIAPLAVVFHSVPEVDHVGVILPTDKRQENVLKKSWKGIWGEDGVSHGDFNVTDLGLSLKWLYDHHHPRFVELTGILQRIGLAKQVIVEEFHSGRGAGQNDLATVTVDGINIGLLSDGTFRILSILSKLVGTDPGSILLIDEPEASIHPGLLRKLLAELESYGMDRHIILATQSPIVVDWAKPEEIRLVERIDGKIQVRGLNGNQLESVLDYLNDAGPLSDYVYSGALE